MQAKREKMQNLQNLRKKIDIIDKKIALLLEKRYALVEKVGRIKKKNKVAVVDKKRDQEILQKFKNPFQKIIFKKIIQNSKKLQKNARKLE